MATLKEISTLQYLMFTEDNRLGRSLDEMKRSGYGGTRSEKIVASGSRTLDGYVYEEIAGVADGRNRYALSARAENIGKTFLLLIDMRKIQRSADDEKPLSSGEELQFWRSTDKNVAPPSGWPSESDLVAAGYERVFLKNPKELFGNTVRH